MSGGDLRRSRGRPTIAANRCWPSTRPPAASKHATMSGVTRATGKLSTGKTDRRNLDVTSRSVRHWPVVDGRTDRRGGWCGRQRRRGLVEPRKFARAEAITILGVLVVHHSKFDSQCRRWVNRATSALSAFGAEQTNLLTTKGKGCQNLPIPAASVAYTSWVTGMKARTMVLLLADVISSVPPIRCTRSLIWTSPSPHEVVVAVSRCMGAAMLAIHGIPVPASSISTTTPFSTDSGSR